MLFDKSFDLEKGRKEVPLILLNVRCILPSGGATTNLCGINGLRERFALIHGFKQRLETLNDELVSTFTGFKGWSTSCCPDSGLRFRGGRLIFPSCAAA